MRIVDRDRQKLLACCSNSLPWSSFGDSRFLLELINSIHDNVPLVVQCGWESPRDAHASDLDVSGRAYDQCDFIRIVMRQLADTLANDEVEWKQCRNCGRFFKYKQPKRLTIRSSHRDAMYCSHKCADNKAHKEKQRRDTAAASRSGNRKKRKRKTRT